MIKMGEIICRIPNNGIKLDRLYCTEPEAMRLDIWSVGLELAMAGLTILLFVVAYFALRTAKGTLRQMKDDSDRQWDSVRTQVAEQDRIAREAAAASRELAREQRQTEWLIKHLQALRTVQLCARRPSRDMVEAQSESSITWAAWSMFLSTDQQPFLALTQEYSDDLMSVTNYIRDLLEKFHVNEVSEEQLRRETVLWGELTGNYIGNLSHWQALPEQRPEKEANIRSNLETMRQFFPHALKHEARVG